MAGKTKGRSLAFLVAVGAACGGGQAATVTWNTSSSGSWNTAGNWTGGAGVPGTADTAALSNVTSGTRTVTVESTPAVATRGIAFTQTGSAVNAFAISSGATLTLTNGGNAFGAATNAAAGVSSVTASIDGTLSFTTANSVAQTLSNTINLGNGGVIQYTSLANPTLNIGGVLNVDPGSTKTSTISALGSASNVSYAFNLLAGSTLNLSSGTLNISNPVAGSGASVALTAAATSTATISSGATLALVTGGGTGNKSASFSNAGSLNQSGALTLLASGSTAIAPAITNTGTWTISGAGAQITQKAGTSAKNLQILNDTAGTLTGAGTLTVSNENAALPFVTLTNNGTINPGAVIGTLAIGNANVAFGAANGTLQIDANGSDAGHYDVLALSAGSTTGTGVLNLSGTNDTVDLRLLNGFNPIANFTLFGFATYQSVVGVFESVKVNGGALPTGWSAAVVNTGSSADLVVTVPEPASLCMAATLIGLASLRRTRRNAEVTNV